MFYLSNNVLLKKTWQQEDARSIYKVCAHLVVTETDFCEWCVSMDTNRLTLSLELKVWNVGGILQVIYNIPYNFNEARSSITLHYDVTESWFTGVEIKIWFKSDCIP